MKGVLVLAHGSREEATEKTLERVIENLKEMVKDTIIETAFLQFSKVNLEAGLNKLVNRGVEDITVIPYFLFSGIHIQEDIPGEINEYKKSHPKISIAMGKTLGEDRRLSEILADRIREAV